MYIRNILVWLVMAGMGSGGVCQSTEQPLNPCPSKTTCSECVRTSSCAWCFQDDFKQPSCFDPATEGGTRGCDEKNIFMPDNVIDVIENRDLSREAAHGAEGNLVLIKPQKVKLQLKINQVQPLSVSYSQAQDFPLDLYYLMDLSQSMKKNKERLSALGSLLSSTMKNITSKFRIGFGSFVDKVVLPYVSTYPHDLENPCMDCVAPYGYKHHMDLSSDADKFVESVNKAAVSGNLDGPEGGFDAIMQAIVCRDIGWREQARRLLIFTTDAGFHLAGDGRLGGILEPNDGQCHLKNNQYSQSQYQDYPSISQINAKVKEHAINVIFAVNDEQKQLYKELSWHIEGSSFGVLEKDSSNVVDLVRDQYNKITSTVEMKHNFPSGLQVEFYSACLGDENKMQQTNKCDGLKIGDVVYFNTKITLLECPKDLMEWKKQFLIYPVGVSERDALHVELELLCDCPCEHPGHDGYKDKEVCNGHGVSKCGDCDCNSGWIGKSCECSAGKAGAAELDRGCRPQAAATGPLCSNRGTCSCGQCICDKMDDITRVISGPYCECANFTCESYKGDICSGPDHGVCVCGRCECSDRYSGPACQCLKDQEPCRSPENGQICSGNGVCVCGQCVCSVSDERRYYGEFCQNCPTCPGQCGEFKDCVQCEVHQRGPMFDAEAPLGAQCGNCSLYPILEEGNIEANESRGEHLCSFYDDEDCLYVFVYAYDHTQHLSVRAQRERECPPKVFILGIVLAVIAAIVLVGLALLMLWKMVTTIYDRREFARFEKERQDSKWSTNANPIYKKPVMKYHNPAFKEQ